MTFFTLVANLSVDLDSSMEVEEGLIAQITATLAVPDREGCKIWVSLLSRLYIMTLV